MVRFAWAPPGTKHAKAVAAAKTNDKIIRRRFRPRNNTGAGPNFVRRAGRPDNLNATQVNLINKRK
jgi:uncharacterized membrane protein